jgi:hypothetical protein
MKFNRRRMLESIAIGCLAAACLGKSAAAFEALPAPHWDAEIEHVRDGKVIDTFTAKNLVTTAGKNFALDTVFAGSAYTAAWFGGLVDNASFSAYAAADTMASHAGWIESTAYSNSTRIAPAFSTASAGSKATSAAMAFTINATATIRGLFINTVSTKSGTTGTLYSAGDFSGGSRAVINGDTLNVSLTLSYT